MRTIYFSAAGGAAAAAAAAACRFCDCIEVSVFVLAAPRLVLLPTRRLHICRRLMQRLAYGKFIVQGGDWGGFVLEAMVRIAPEQILGAHSNFPVTLPPTIATLVSTLLFDSKEERARANVVPSTVRVVPVVMPIVELVVSAAPARLLPWFFVIDERCKYDCGCARARVCVTTEMPIILLGVFLAAC